MMKNARAKHRRHRNGSEKMNEDTEQPIQKDHQITKINRQADVLDQARLRPHNTVLRYKHDGRIINLLLNLQSRGKADLTMKFVSNRLKYLAKFADLDDPEAVDLFMASARVRQIMTVC
jgi:hypothetical protein